jgi:hypothetical protein
MFTRNSITPAHTTRVEPQTHIRTFYLAGLVRAGETDPKVTLRLLAGEIFRWARPKYVGTLPILQMEDQHEAFESGAYSLGVACADDCACWGIRLREPDKPFGDRQPVAGRTWATDITLQAESSAVKLRVDVSCTSEYYADSDIAYERPRIATHLVRKHNVWNGQRITAVPVGLTTHNELRPLYEFLIDKSRRQAVVLLTESDADTRPLDASPYVLDASYVADKVVGAAYVVTLPQGLSYAWADMVGKQWSAYGGAVRTYLPGIDFETDSPYRHKLAMLDQLLSWSDRNGEGAPCICFVFEHTVCAELREGGP